MPFHFYKEIYIIEDHRRGERQLHSEHTMVPIVHSLLTFLIHLSLNKLYTIYMGEQCGRQSTLY